MRLILIHFVNVVKDSLQGRHFQPTTSVLQIDENDIVLSSVESLSLLEPFGMKNEEPLYISLIIHDNIT